MRLWGRLSRPTPGWTRTGVHNVHFVQGVELEKVEFFCEALGSLQPTFTWLYITRIGVHNVHCVQGVELEKMEFFCEALGSPQPAGQRLEFIVQLCAGS